ncbi:MAG: DUF5666 domain-containing protein [Candidatus Sulfobium sp.]|jgi:ribosomal protein S1
MKKILAIVLSLFFLFGAASLSFAAMKQLTGKVTALDKKAMTITVHGRRGEVTATIDQKTKIVEGKEKKALDDVQVGAKVTLKYTKADGKAVAKRIVIKEAAQAKEKAPAMPGY